MIYEYMNVNGTDMYIYTSTKEEFRKLRTRHQARSGIAWGIADLLSLKRRVGTRSPTRVFLPPELQCCHGDPRKKAVHGDLLNIIIVVVEVVKIFYFVFVMLT